MVTERKYADDMREYTLENDLLKVNILEYGATIHNIFYKGTDCISGYDDPMGYVKGRSHQAATVGRYANRIGGAAFTLGGKKYTLDANNMGVNCLHGGKSGFSHKLFKGEITGENAVTLTIKSADGEGGFPGELMLKVTFSIQAGTLKIEYNAVSSKDTVVCFTNHAYFTLGADSALDTELMIKADRITDIDENMIPTGRFTDVGGTPFDFRTAKPIGRDIFENYDKLTLTHGYDHNFVLGEKKEYRKDVVIAYNKKTGITLKCSTDMPGIQLYTANGLNEQGGKGGAALTKYSAFCLETQFFPDSPNKPDFPSCVLKAGEQFYSVTEYSFEG